MHNTGVNAKVEKFGSYVPFKELGKGSFGMVYAATKEDYQGGFTYAVKVIQAPRELTERTSLEREVNIQTMIRHPYIVEVLEHFYKNESDPLSPLCIVFEHCNLGDLARFIKSKGNLTDLWPVAPAALRYFLAIVARQNQGRGQGICERMVESFMMQVGSALDFMHTKLGDKPVIHRDIKAENLLLVVPDATAVHAGHPYDIPMIKVGDFGLARRLESKSDKAKTHCGTVVYMAPEVLLEKHYDLRADSWSVGVLLFFMTYGELPFPYPSKQKVIDNATAVNQHTLLPDQPRTSDEQMRIGKKRDNAKVLPQAKKHITTWIRGFLTVDVGERTKISDWFQAGRSTQKVPTAASASATVDTTIYTLVAATEAESDATVALPVSPSKDSAEMQGLRDILSELHLDDTHTPMQSEYRPTLRPLR
ncbi:hypothetical protein CF327_g2041 [Tilletia walkeri]|nr:hypothetical protein CF327_g2041 [Tilletia walkeri]